MIRALAACLVSAAALLSALPAWSAGDAVEGEAVYQRTCARCHRSAERLVPLIAGPDRGATTAYLDRFLADHMAPDPAARADLIAYLLKLSGQ